MRHINIDKLRDFSHFQIIKVSLAYNLRGRVGLSLQSHKSV